MVIDTGLSAADKDFVSGLAEVLDPSMCDGYGVESDQPLEHMGVMGLTVFGAAEFICAC